MLHKQDLAHDEAITCVSMGRNNETGLTQILTGSSDNTAKAWKWNDEKEADDDQQYLELRFILDDHSLGLISVQINREGTIAVSSAMDSHIHLWDLENGTPLQTINCTPVDSWTAAFSPDSNQIATGSHFGKVNCYDVKTGKLLNSLDTAGKFILSVAYVSVRLCLPAIST